jgi:DNA polymerase delta subunit 3
MLYEFHRKQNAKKPGTVHATYLITGIRRIEPPQQPNGVHKEDGEDTVMQSSPVLPSSSIPMQDDVMEEAKLVRTVLLVKEEDLEQAKNTFDTISSIHIYSLESNTLKDLHVLTECNRKVGAEYASEDPLEAWKQYGTIQNPNVKRRARGTAPPPPPPVVRAAEVKAKAAEIKAESKASSNNATPEPEKKGITKPAATKRQNSDIFKSFAKAKTKPKNESQSSVEASPAPQVEDAAMTGFSDDEPDDEPAEEAAEQANILEGKLKKERRAELEAMMDAEDEEMEDVTTPAAESQDAESPAAKAEVQRHEEPKETVTVENGRRRGRRRVMKKKTVKDEEGYLGTSQI